MLDLRLPIGFYFLINAAILIGVGITNPSSSMFGSASVNLNVVWGVVMAVFGAIMLALYTIEKKKSKPE